MSKKMQEILDGYNEIFLKWSSQRLKINDLDRDILCLEADLKAEKKANLATVEDETGKARAELKEAEDHAAALEADLEHARATLSDFTSYDNSREYYDLISLFYNREGKEGDAPLRDYDTPVVTWPQLTSERLADDLTGGEEEDPVAFTDGNRSTGRSGAYEEKSAVCSDTEMGRAKVVYPERQSVAELERELACAEKEVESCRKYCDFVTETYREQMKLWEVAYERYSLRISNLRERLNVEEAILVSYSAELEEWKTKLQDALKKEV